MNDSTCGPRVFATAHPHRHFGRAGSAGSAIATA